MIVHVLKVVGVPIEFVHDGGNVVFDVDAEVIHVDFQPFLSQYVGEDVIHEYLKCGGALQNPKNLSMKGFPSLSGYIANISWAGNLMEKVIF